MTTKKVERRIKIKYRIRKNVFGTAERPRLSVFRSNKQIYAQTGTLGCAEHALANSVFNLNSSFYFLRCHNL